GERRDRDDVHQRAEEQRTREREGAAQQRQQRADAERAREHRPRRVGGQPPAAPDGLGRDRDRGHQLAPENSARRLITQRAARLTANVSRNRNRPVAMSTSAPSAPASGNWLAMFAAIDWCWPGRST